MYSCYLCHLIDTESHFLRSWRDDLMVDLFKDLLGSYDLVDFIPPVLEPTSTNGRSGKEGILKILDIFVVKASLVHSFQIFRTWVGKNKISDHWPIFLQIEGTLLKHNYPFKLNTSLLENDYFFSFVKDTWINYIVVNAWTVLLLS